MLFNLRWDYLYSRIWTVRRKSVAFFPLFIILKNFKTKKNQKMMKKVPLQNIKRNFKNKWRECGNPKQQSYNCEMFAWITIIYSRICARARNFEKIGVLATFPFFRNPPPTIRDPEKKPKKIMHPFSRLAFMNMEKKRIFCETAKKFNWCNTVFLYFWFLSHHFTYVLTNSSDFLLPKREFQYTFQVGTTTFFAFLSVTLYAFFLALNS